MRSYIINKDKNIGNVIFVVEGGRAESGGTELRLLKKVFSDILGYEVKELRRGSDEFIGHGRNSSFHVFALNLPKNQLTQLNAENLDSLFLRLRNEFNVKPEDCPIFFLYDRDFLSYKPNELRNNYVKKYTDPYGNDNGDQGQLLLSYPAVESFLLSCLQEDSAKQSYFLGKDIKPVLTKLISTDSLQDYEQIHQKTVDIVFSEDTDVAEGRLLHSLYEMDKGLELLGIEQYDLDYLEPTLLAVYDSQQEKCRNENTFSVLSLIGMALLELGVITEEEI